MKYSCCIEMIFTEFDFVERIYKAREAGFDAVEFWCWENKDINAVKKALAETGMKVAIMQGNLEGRMVDEKDYELYIEGVKKSVTTAKEIGVKNLFLMSDIMQEDRSVKEAPYSISDKEKKVATLRILKALVPIAEENGITFVIEPLNTTVDHRGYSLCHSRPGMDMINEVNHPNIRLLYDVYHMQIMEGNIINTIKAGYQTFGYFHIADVPGRFQPGTGELNYLMIVKALRETGYDKYIGFEFEVKDAPSMEVCKELLTVLKC